MVWDSAYSGDPVLRIGAKTNACDRPVASRHNLYADDDRWPHDPGALEIRYGVSARFIGYADAVAALLIGTGEEVLPDF